MQQSFNSKKKNKTVNSHLVNKIGKTEYTSFRGGKNESFTNTIRKTF